MADGVRALIVGCGKSGQLFYDAARRLHGITLIGLVSSDGCGARELAMGRVRHYSKDDDWLAAHPELVIVASPHDRHVEQALSALDGGAHVLIDKPVAINCTSFARLLERDRSSSHAVYCGFSQRCNDDMLDCRRLLHNSLGRVVRVSVRQALHRPDSYFVNWKGSYRRSGGGVLCNQAIHAIDLVSFLLGDRLSYLAGTLSDERRQLIEGTADLRLCSLQSIPVDVHVTTCAPIEERQEIRFDMNDGSTIIVTGSELPTWYRQARGAPPIASPTSLPPDPYGPAHLAMLRDVIQAISTSSRTEFALELVNCLDSHLVVFDAYRSAHWITR